LYHIFGHIHEGYGVWTDGTTTYVNASTCTLRYKPDNKPIVFDLPRDRELQPDAATGPARQMSATGHFNSPLVAITENDGTASRRPSETLMFRATTME
jgi:hypothetical protein